VPKNRSAQNRMMLPGTIDRMVVDTFRGQYRVKAWPKKRGPTSDPIQQQRIDRFANANRLAKFIAGPWWIKAQKLAKGTGLYPRDILVQAMTAGAWDLAMHDGTLVTQKRWELNQVSFQGCVLQKTATQSILANTETPINWDGATIQTWPFFDAAFPQRLTVPSNVARVRLSAGIRSVASVTSPHFIIIRQTGTTLRAAQSVAYTGAVNLTTQTAVIDVTAGNWFDCRVFWGGAGTFSAVSQCYFQAEIMETT